MLPDDSWSFAWWIRASAYTLFAAFGGVMGQLMRTIDKKEKIVWGRAVMEGLAAGFVGLLMLFICQASSFSEQWTGVIVGVSGWLGANATIRMLETLVRKKLGIESPQQEPSDVKTP
jgi:hypothetical protein